MRLTCVNFRCYSKRTFTFRTDYCLISGPSGSGKTSIFMAVHFAVTGEGRRLVKYGCRSCSVSLEIDGKMEITRTKGPCRLVVVTADGRRSEDAEAQATIDEKLAGWTWGYVSQRLHRSFVSVTPAEKLQWIGKFAFSNFDIEAIHGRCKALTADRMARYRAASNQREALESVLRRMGVERAESTESVADLERALRAAEAEETARQRLVARKEALRSNVDDLTRRLRSLSSSSDVDDGISSVDEIERLIALKGAYDLYVSKRTELESIEPSGIDDLDALIAETMEMVSLERDSVDLEAEEERLNRFERAGGTVALTCPSCASSLGLSAGGALRTLSGPVAAISLDEMRRNESRLAEATVRVRTMREKRSRLNELLSGYEERPDDLERQLRNLRDAKRDDDRLRALTAAVSELRCDEPAAADTIETLRRRERRLAMRDVLVPRLEEAKRELAQLPDESIPVRSPAELERRLGEAKAKEHYDRLDELMRLESSAESAVRSATKLACLIKTAERLAMERTLNRVNSIVESFLDGFFPDADVTATLGFESGKINLDVRLNEDECDVSSLSGGEYARVALAFAVTMAIINRSPILLLDESFASLDADASDAVIGTLRDGFDGRIIVIAHQTTKGAFDEVTELL